MTNEIACIPLELQSYMNTENTELIIPTLCENVTLYSKIEEVTCYFKTKSSYLVRLLDYRVTLPLELYDVSDLTIDDFNPDSFSEIFEEEKTDWDLYKQENPISVARHFLASAHLDGCKKVFRALEKKIEPSIHEPLYKFFSEEEKNILTSNNIRVMQPKDKVKGTSSKGSFSTSFLKMFNGVVEDTDDDIEFIELKIREHGFSDIHTGFAFGDIDCDIGVFEYDGISKEPETNGLKHVSFWKFRSSTCYIELIQNFQFINL
ncbi:hypothetical protein [Carnobacterium maltaromaticum]|uniref:hypothetical protein n=1 Tax=Carnobacterium maltaromaticum TaxID=2751 RepID=UPI00295EA2AD|nr:hypothetical protein [Carnobacterium maltaromaticum]